jgi:hypothetical protein
VDLVDLIEVGNRISYRQERETAERSDAFVFPSELRNFPLILIDFGGACPFRFGSV